MAVAAQGVGIGVGGKRYSCCYPGGGGGVEDGSKGCECCLLGGRGEGWGQGDMAVTP